MLQVHVPEIEYFDSVKQEFISIKAQDLTMEHSLISISKWESKWKKPFLETTDKTFDETIDYFKCMTLTPNVNPIVYQWLPMDVYGQIREYIEDSMTATWFKDKPKNSTKGSTVTSEIIYYWMVMFGIPFECQKWHLNRLLTLIRVCELKQQPSKKGNTKDMLASNWALNAKRRRELGTRG